MPVLTRTITETIDTDDKPQNSLSFAWDTRPDGTRYIIVSFTTVVTASDGTARTWSESKPLAQTSLTPTEKTNLRAYLAALIGDLKPAGFV